MVRMKTTLLLPDASKEIELEAGSDSEGDEDEFLKSLDSYELELIECIAKSPPEGNFKYFVSDGLCEEGENPHRLKELKLIPTLEIEKVFGKWSNRTGYRYKDCQPLALQQKIERIWKLAFSKDKIVATQFAIGIVSEQMENKVR